MVTREKLVMNRGKRKEHCTGLPGKLYNRARRRRADHRLDEHDVLQDGVVDLPSIVDDQRDASLVRRQSSVDEHLYSMGLGPAPVEEPSVLCKGCRSTNRNDFIQTSDKSHMGLQVRRRGLARAHRAGAREELRQGGRQDHARRQALRAQDRPLRPPGPLVRGAAQAARARGHGHAHQQEGQAEATAWAGHRSTTAREAAVPSGSGRRWSRKDQTKGQHIIIELDKLFTPLEPIDNQIKRFCRMEADRVWAWREAVRHSKICNAKGRCQLRIKEKGPTVIADAALSLLAQQPALRAATELTGVTHAGLLVIADKLGALQSAKGTSCALRAVRTIVGTYLTMTKPTPSSLPRCLLPGSASRHPPPPPDASARRSGRRARPFMRTDSSVSDIGDAPAASCSSSATASPTYSVTWAPPCPTASAM